MKRYRFEKMLGYRWNRKYIRRESMESIYPTIDKKAKKPIYQQIYKWIRMQIMNEQLKAGEKLPSIRKMSTDLNVSKNTIVIAYEQLLAEGYIESIPKIGYKVAFMHSIMYEEKKESKVYEHKQKDPINYKYNLTGKGIDPNVFQQDLWKKVNNTILREEFDSLTYYGDPQGEMALREEIVKYIFENRGIICNPQDIIIGAGTQICLNLICQMLLESRPKIAYEMPGTKWLRFMFERFGFELTDLMISEKGYDVEHIYKSNSDVIFVTPSHQFMKGKTISTQNRIELLNWAYKQKGLIIEDDYDSEVRYLTDTIPPLKSMDKNDRVIYIGSLSKIYMPSLRIAFMILPPAMLKMYYEKFYLYEQTSSVMLQNALAKFMKEGYFDSHIRRLKKQYRLKSAQIVKSLDIHMKDKVEIIFSKGGVTLLLAVNTNKSEEELIESVKKNGIKIKSLAEVYARHMDYHQKGRPKVYLTFKMLPLEQIDQVISLLASIWFA